MTTDAKHAVLEEFIRKLLEKLSDAQRQSFRAWIEGLVNLRAQNIPLRQKVIKTLQLTRAHIDLVPIIKQVAGELKRLGWDERGWAARLGLWASVPALVLGGGGAGIAALGGAVGLPPWIVLGAGGAFAGMIVDEISKAPGSAAPAGRACG